MIDQFKSFLFNETKYYLGQRAGDILTALQNLQDDSNTLGNRALIRASQGVVNQIRRILHGRWDEGDVKYLKHLQKIGVAIMQAIDEKGDLPEVISSAVAEVEKMLSDLETPVNSLGSEDAPKEEPIPSEESDDFNGMELGA